MLTLGRRDESDEPGALIVACHARIRGFLAAAARLASDAPATDDDVATTAAGIARYFRIALPLHEADEDRSIAPRMTGAAAALMIEVAREHAGFAAPIAALIASADRLAAAPTERAHLRSSLASTIASLETGFAPHLDREEAVMVTAIAALPAATRAEIRAEMRARRDP